MGMAMNAQRGWWYPYIFVAFFLVVVGVNLGMAYFATSTFTGLSTDNAYEKGIAYNRNLAMAKAQAELGWTVDAKIAGDARNADVTVTYRDRDGRPVDGLDVQALLTRPTVTGLDQRVALAKRGDGTYGTVLAVPESGEWDFDIIAVGRDSAYQMQRRFILP